MKGMVMDCTTPYLTEMNDILRKKRASGMCGIRLFVQKSGDCTSEDIARGFCAMEKAEKAKAYQDISDVAL